MKNLCSFLIKVLWVEWNEMEHPRSTETLPVPFPNALLALSVALRKRICIFDWL